MSALAQQDDRALGLDYQLLQVGFLGPWISLGINRIGDQEQGGSRMAPGVLTDSLHSPTSKHLA